MTVRAYKINTELASSDYAVANEAKAESVLITEKLFNDYFKDPEKLYEFFNPEYEYQLSQQQFWDIALLSGANKITGAKHTARDNAIKALQKKGVDIAKLRELAETYKKEQDELRLRQ